MTDRKSKPLSYRKYSRAHKGYCLLDICIQLFFFNSVAYVFVFLMGFEELKAYQYFSLSIWFAILVFALKTPCLFPGCKDFSPRLSSGHFMVLTMTFMSFIHFGLISEYGMRQRFNVHFFPFMYI